MNRHASVGGMVLALGLSALAVYYFVTLRPGPSEVVRIVAFGDRWMDLSQRDMRVFGLDGQLLGEYWSGSRGGYACLTFSPNGLWAATCERVQAGNGSPEVRVVVYSVTTGWNRQAVITGASSPSWSPNSQEIAFNSFDATEPDGEHVVRIADLSCMDQTPNCAPSIRDVAVGTAPAWSPISTELAMFLPDGTLVIVDYVGGHREVIDVDRASDCRAPRFSPSGRYIAYMCFYDDIWIYDRQASQRRPYQKNNEDGIVADYEWLLTSDDLLVLTCNYDDGLCKSPFPWIEEAKITRAVYETNLDGQARRRVTLGDSDSFASFAIWPPVTP